jgi:hypothetical protein
VSMTYETLGVGQSRPFTRVAQSASLRVIRLHDARHGTAILRTADGMALRVVMRDPSGTPRSASP